MKMHSFVGRLFRSPILRCSSVALVMLAWSTPAFCGEIHLAARNGDLAKVKSLLKDNPDLVFSRDGDNRTPLHWAALSSQKNVCELLLANKADTNAKDNEGNTPSDLAVKSGHQGGRDAASSWQSGHNPDASNSAETVIGDPRTQQRTAPQETAAKALPHEIPEKPPKHAIAWLDDKGQFYLTYVRGVGSFLPPIEYLVFDPAKKMAGAPKGISTLYQKESPVAFVLYDMNNLGSSSASGKYSNIEMDVSELHGRMAEVAVMQQVTPDSKYLCSISLLASGHTTLTVPDDYQVFADGEREMRKGGPFIRLRFVTEGTDLKAGTIVILRNGMQVMKSTLESIAKDGILLGSLKKTDDFIEWRITGPTGSVVKSGLLGFPVSGVRPDLVDYVVYLNKVQ